MNTVRIVKDDAKPIKRVPPGAAGNEAMDCYWAWDTILVETQWTAEELAVLAGLDLDITVMSYLSYLESDEYMRELCSGNAKNFTILLRSHIQAEIKKRQE